MIEILRYLKFELNRLSLERPYLIFVRPLLEYADVVWANFSNGTNNDMNDVPYEAARIVTGTTKVCNLNRLLEDLKWKTLAARRKKYNLVLL